MIKTKLSFIISIAACFLSAVMLVTACLAWFAFNTDTDVGGVEFVTSNSRITFGDELISRRKFGDRAVIMTTYAKDDEGAYYDITSPVDERAYFSMTGILPEESIDITASLDAELLTNNFTLEIGLGKISGDSFEYGDRFYSVLGVFCVYPFIYDATRIEESEDKDGFFLDTERRTWLSEYGSESTVTNSTSVAVMTEKWTDLYLSNDGNTATFKFRLELNLEQYREQDIQQQNLLSQKNISIGSVYALVML